MQHEHLNAVRIDEKTNRGVFMTRFGTRTDHPMLAERSPLTKPMQPGEVWRVRWHSAGVRGGTGADRADRCTSGRVGVVLKSASASTSLRHDIPEHIWPEYVMSQSTSKTYLARICHVRSIRRTHVYMAFSTSLRSGRLYTDQYVHTD
jgi:hypothetical protein